MKISNYRPTGINPYQRELNKTENAVKSESSKTADKIEISKEALRLQKQQFDPMRQEKIHDLKRRIEDGTYTIDYTEVARKMIQSFKNRQ